MKIKPIKWQKINGDKDHYAAGHVGKRWVATVTAEDFMDEPANKKLWSASYINPEGGDEVWIDGPIDGMFFKTVKQAMRAVEKRYKNEVKNILINLRGLEE